jgi:hypothetical protein
MMPQLTLTALFGCALVCTLACVHLWSADAGRRRRAYRLIKLLLGR